MKLIAPAISALAFSKIDLIEAKNEEPSYKSCKSLNKIIKADKSTYKKAVKCFDSKKYPSQNKFEKCFDKALPDAADNISAEFRNCWQSIVNEENNKKNGEDDEDSPPQCLDDIKNNKKAKKFLKCFNEDKLDAKIHKKCVKKAKGDAKQLLADCYEEVMAANDANDEASNDEASNGEASQPTSNADISTQKCEQDLGKNKKAKKVVDCLRVSNDQFSDCLGNVNKWSDNLMSEFLDCRSTLVELLDFDSQVETPASVTTAPVTPSTVTPVSPSTESPVTPSTVTPVTPEESETQPQTGSHVDPDGYTCLSIGSNINNGNPTEGNGWSEGSHRKFECNINYPTNGRTGYWYMLAEFSAPVDTIMWWSGPEPSAVDAGKKTWKLFPTQENYKDRDPVQFNFHVQHKNAEDMKGTEYTYCYICEDCEPVEESTVVPTPSEPTPSEPTPVVPTPSEPTPVVPSPSEPTPSTPTPSEPTPSTPTPSEPTPVAPTPSEPTPVAPTPTESTQAATSDFECHNIGDISTVKQPGWNENNNWKYAKDLNYAVPDNQKGEWYLIVTFGVPVYRIQWWEWPSGEDTKGTSTIDEEGKVWKLEPSMEWFANGDVSEIEIQPLAQGNGIPSESYQYCWKPCVGCENNDTNNNGSNNNNGNSNSNGNNNNSGSTTDNGSDNGISSGWSKDYQLDSDRKTSGSAINAVCDSKSSGGGQINQSCSNNFPANWNFDCSTRSSSSSSLGGVCRPNQNGQPMQTVVNSKTDNLVNKQGQDYNKALHLSLLFYEANQNGVLPSWNRIPWRNHANLYDGCDISSSEQLDMTGGWYDAGDNVKFHNPMAQSAVALLFGAIEFENAWIEAGEMENLENNMKYITDYFMKTHPTGTTIYYGQVGHGQYDHDNYARPELMNDQCRPVWKCDENHPCTEPAAETAGALAAAYIFFEKRGQTQYAEKALAAAASLMDYADTYRSVYTKSVTDASTYYNSWGGYYDELVDGWAWLARAYDHKGDESSKKEEAINKAMGIYILKLDNSIPNEYSWDDKTMTAVVNLAQLTDEPRMWQNLDKFVDQRFVNRAQTTGEGQPWVNQWGSNRYAANLAFIGILAAKKHEELGVAWTQGLSHQKVINKAQKTANYMLGDNNSNQSYLIGYGDKYPQNPHHKSSGCPAWGSDCGWGTFGDNTGPSPHVLYGALVGGPDQNDRYTDKRSDYISNEVTTDYNAGFTSLIAGLKEEFMSN